MGIGDLSDNSTIGFLFGAALCVDIVIIILVWSYGNLFSSALLCTHMHRVTLSSSNLM